MSVTVRKEYVGIEFEASQGASFGDNTDFPSSPRPRQIAVVNGVPYIWTVIESVEMWYPVALLGRKYELRDPYIP